jgi:hypothetical protein
VANESKPSDPGSRSVGEASTWRQPPGTVIWAEIVAASATIPAQIDHWHDSRVRRPRTEPGDGHGVFNKAVDQWLPDVLRFLQRWLSSTESRGTV